MMYTSGRVAAGRRPAGPRHAPRHARSTSSPTGCCPTAGGRVLDVGCGWGGTCAGSSSATRVAGGVGLTLSPAQVEHVAADPIARRRGPAARAGREHAPARALRRDRLVRRLRALRPGRHDRPGTDRGLPPLLRPLLTSGWPRAAGSASRRSRTTTRPTPRRRSAAARWATSCSSSSRSRSARTCASSCSASSRGSRSRCCASDAADFARTCRAWLVGLRQHDDEAASARGSRHRQAVPPLPRRSESSSGRGRSRTTGSVLHRRPSANGDVLDESWTGREHRA